MLAGLPLQLISLMTMLSVWAFADAGRAMDGHSVSRQRVRIAYLFILSLILNERGLDKDKLPTQRVLNGELFCAFIAAWVTGLVKVLGGDNEKSPANADDLLVPGTGRVRKSITARSCVSILSCSW